MANLPWVDKYRPQLVQDVLGHEEVLQTIKSFLRKGELPHILLHGPPGTGKTSLIQALAKKLHRENVKQMVLELNASDDRGIAVVRNQIKTFAESRPPLYMARSQTPKSANEENQQPDLNMGDASVGPQETASGQKDLRSFFSAPKTTTMGDASANDASVKSESAKPGSAEPEVADNLRQIKLVVLDEVDQMTSAAQTALRRIMEKYAGNVRFFLMCNDVARINAPIQSRCTKFRFSPLPRGTIETKLRMVLAQEGLKLEADAADLLLDIAGGDFRRLLNTLQATALAFPTTETHPALTADMFYRVLGLPTQKELADLLSLLATCSLSDGYYRLKSLCDSGYNLLDILQAIYKQSLKCAWSNTRALTFYPRIADIEQDLHAGASEQIQMAALMGAIVEAREADHGVALSFGENLATS